MIKTNRIWKVTKLALATMGIFATLAVSSMSNPAEANIDSNQVTIGNVYQFSDSAEINGCNRIGSKPVGHGSI